MRGDTFGERLSEKWQEHKIVISVVTIGVVSAVTIGVMLDKWLRKSDECRREEAIYQQTIDDKPSLKGLKYLTDIVDAACET